MEKIGANIVQPEKQFNAKLTVHMDPTNQYPKKTLSQSRSFFMDQTNMISEKVPQYDLKLWSHWVDIFNDTSSNFGMYFDNKGDYDDKQYKLFDYKYFYKILKKIEDGYNKYYGKDNDWMSMIGGNIKPDWKIDPVFGQKVEVSHNKDTEILVIGDIHSSFHSLFDIITKNRDSMFKGNTMTLKNNKYIIFLGDIVDRGPYSLELLLFVFNLKLENFNKVFIINGNHEDYGDWKRSMGKEIISQFPSSNDDFIKKVLWFLPSVIFLKFGNEWYHLSHGAFMDEHSKNDDIKTFLGSKKPFLYLERENKNNELKWGDFYNSESKFTNMLPYDRSHFGVDVTNRYLDRNGIKCIISGHQDVVNLAIMSGDINKYKKIIDMGSKQFEKCSQGHGYGYDLLCIKMDNKKYPDELELHPGKGDKDSNFIALVTSTATISKNIQTNTYLKFRSVKVKKSTGLSGGKREGQNGYYYTKYMKYKTKYMLRKSEL
jgi:hypothetical protein